MSFTDQKQRIATEKDCNARWNGREPGKGFRCYLCGHKFEVGDKWRWVYMGPYKLLNVMVCEHCDGPNEEIAEKWQGINDEFYNNPKFWVFRDQHEIN